MAFDNRKRMSNSATVLDELNLSFNDHVSIGPNACPSGFWILVLFPIVYTVPAGVFLWIAPCSYYTTTLRWSVSALYTVSCIAFYANNLSTFTYRYYCTEDMRFFKILNTLNVFAALGNSALFFALFTKDGELWFAFLGMACYFVSVSEYFPAMRQEHSIVYCRDKSQCSETPCGRSNPLLTKDSLYISFTAIYLISQILWITFVMVYIQELVSDERPDNDICMDISHLQG